MSALSGLLDWAGGRGAADTKLLPDFFHRIRDATALGDAAGKCRQFGICHSPAQAQRVGCESFHSAFTVTPLQLPDSDTVYDPSE